MIRIFAIFFLSLFGLIQTDTGLCEDEPKMQINSVSGSAGEVKQGAVEIESKGVINIFYQNPSELSQLKYELLFDSKNEKSTFGIARPPRKPYVDLTLSGDPEILKTPSNETKMEMSFDASTFRIHFIEGFFFVDIIGLTLAGVNQQWLNCSQPLCIYGQLDAAYTFSGRSFVIRGKHIWDIEKATLTRNAMPFHEKHDIIPAYVDSAFGVSDRIFFSKGSNLYCTMGDGRFCPRLERAKVNSNLGSIVSNSNDFAPNHLIEAGFGLADSDRVVLFVYEVENEPKLYVFKREGDGVTPFKGIAMAKITEPYLRNGIDAAFVLNKNIILFKRNEYFELPISEFDQTNLEGTFRNIKVNLTYKNLFKCPESVYRNKSWVYDEGTYLEKFRQLYETKKPLEEMKKAVSDLKQDFRPSTTPNTFTRSEADNFFVYFLIGAALVTFLIVVVALIYGERRRRIRIRRFRKGGKDIKSRSLIGDDLLDRKYKPGAKPTPSQLDMKVDKKQRKKPGFLHKMKYGPTSSLVSDTSVFSQTSSLGSNVGVSTSPLSKSRGSSIPKGSSTLGSTLSPRGTGSSLT